MKCVNLPSATCKDLLTSYAAQSATQSLHCNNRGKLLRFACVGRQDVYNISAPFDWNGTQFLLGRVESRDTENSDIVFFSKSDDSWVPSLNCDVLKGLQDPCFIFIDGKIILNGVRYPIPVDNEQIGWRTRFYGGSSPNNLKLLLEGPDNMKDIRLKKLPDGRIAVLTRPWGKKAGRGKIGFIIVDSLNSITPQLLQDAPCYWDLFADNEWGGVNEVHVLNNDKLGILGHIACFDEFNHRHYYAMTFIIDIATGLAGNLRIIAQRSDFPRGPAKRIDLTDVIFSGGLIRNSQGTAELYAGLSDVQAGWLLIPDPFLDSELCSETPCYRLS